MTCVHFGETIVCFRPMYRLRLEDGGYVYMEWHSYFGPTFYRDRASRQEIVDWWDIPDMVRAYEWFQQRGCRA